MSLMTQETTIFTFKISVLFDEWVKAFDGSDVAGPTINKRLIVLNNPL